ncbi:hypothetical protein CEXT_781441 [Caerostris extrusa]|uniref:Uncharacterized protein n=1 Tax=Caerostris extrusa TaxID=172846 RepID=A0AAV4SPQ5_CAEEX|nr:hypothetical protein CEXT_781441 [Caerostris extrusa]
MVERSLSMRESDDLPFSPGKGYLSISLWERSRKYPLNFIRNRKQEAIEEVAIPGTCDQILPIKHRMSGICGCPSATLE